MRYKDMTEKFDLSIKMSDLVETYGITAVTNALIDKVESNKNWRQMETLTNVIKQRKVA